MTRRPEDPAMAAPALRAQMSAALLHTLEGLGRAFLALRVAATVLLIPALAAALVWAGDHGWRLWVLGGLEAILLASTVVDLRWPGPATPRRLTAYMGLIFLIHTGFIVTTGGIESPGLPVYIPVTVMLSVAVGRGRTFLLTLGVLAAVVGALLAARLAGWGTEVPGLLRSLPPAPVDPVYLGLAGGLVVVFMAVGGALGLKLRQNLDAAALEVSRARAETLAAVQAQNRELATLSGALAHELKNPLAAIQSLSGLVARKLPGDSREAEQMGVLIGEVKRLGGILDEFLNLSRPADGLNASAQDPAELVRGVARLYAAAVRERAVDLQVACAPCAPLRCDPRKVRQVLINLVENALQHGPAGGTVILRLAEREGHAVFTVRDQGPGPAAAERAFEAGYTTRPEGTGLGLTVALAIAHQHGGDLTLAAAHPGAVATLTLPLEPPA